MRARSSLIYALGLSALACQQFEDAPEASTLVEQEIDEGEVEDEPAPYCGNTTLGCIELTGDPKLACADECSLPLPCPTMTVAAYGHSAEAAQDTACLIDALLTMDEPIQLVHGTAVETGDIEPYYDVRQWTLWALGEGRVVLRSEVSYDELAGMGSYTHITGGELPTTAQLQGCAARSGQAVWTCIIGSIAWCEDGVVTGPTGDQPWCPG